MIETLRPFGLFDAHVPRYTSYPTAPVFSAENGTGFQTECLAALNPAAPVSVYVHIPFCERLCWFCACHTQGTTTLAPVEAYIETLEAELALIAAQLPAGVQMGRLHWGGGTPTILPPPLIHRLAAAIRAVLPPAETFDFSVEIDPSLIDADKINALHAEGMTRASIGIQDFAPEVQAAIGREQSFEMTRACVDMLRAGKVESLNTDLVYGLPHQSEARIADTIEKVLTLAPDRVALFGYAHVPHMSRRQKLIPEEHLPGNEARYRLATLAANALTDAGLQAIGIDHFARPEDELSRAADARRLRRNFQGYTDDTCASLIGIGASSISRFPAGYVQNATATAAYSERVKAGLLPGYRGHRLDDEDRLRARAIEMIMCEFRIDQPALRAEFGAAADALEATHSAVARDFAPFAERASDGLRLLPEGAALTRIVARAYDGYTAQGAIFSKAT